MYCGVAGAAHFPPKDRGLHVRRGETCRIHNKMSANASPGGARPRCVNKARGEDALANGLGARRLGA